MKLNTTYPLNQLLVQLSVTTMCLSPTRTTPKLHFVRISTSPINKPCADHSFKIFTKVSKFLLTFTPWSSMI